MENFFIVKYFQWARPKESAKIRLANRLLAALGFWPRLQAPQFDGVHGPSWGGIMTNVEQRMNLYHLASQVLAYGVPGDLVELGCNQGESSVLIQKVIDHFDPSRQFHVYDSFEGLPPVSDKDAGTTFVEGACKTNRAAFVENFRHYNLRLPHIHEGWFDKTLPTQLPEQICFAYLDGDFYDSILVSLQHVYPRMSRGAICLIDDYADRSVYPEGWDKLPGVKRACDEYLAGKPERMSYIYAGLMSHGFFRKQ